MEKETNVTAGAFKHMDAAFELDITGLLGDAKNLLWANRRAYNAMVAALNENASRFTKVKEEMKVLQGIQSDLLLVARGHVHCVKVDAMIPEVAMVRDDKTYVKTTISIAHMNDGAAKVKRWHDLALLCNEQIRHDEAQARKLFQRAQAQKPGKYDAPTPEYTTTARLLQRRNEDIKTLKARRLDCERHFVEERRALLVYLTGLSEEMMDKHSEEYGLCLAKDLGWDKTDDIRRKETKVSDHSKKEDKRTFGKMFI